MKNVLVMAVSNSLQRLQDNVADDVLTDCWLALAPVGSLALILSDQVEDSSLDQFKDKVQFIANADDLF